MSDRRARLLRRLSIALAMPLAAAIVALVPLRAVAESPAEPNPAVAAKPSAEALARFENYVRPILVQQCVACHGPKKSEAGLRLDTFAGALKGGDTGAAVVPGQPKQSLLVKAVRHEDGLEMPKNGKLTEHDVAALERWVAEGAAWPEGAVLAGGTPSLRSGPITAAERAFWSFQPIADPKPPAVNDRWIQNDVDRFVLARLQSAGLRPNAAADRRPLLRRATFDLTGLPPTPAEMDAFLADSSADAYRKVIDRLLASPAYGERWGRHWLDVVHYADTAGETADYPTPLAWKYRNWVIAAINADEPYDQFVREQVAGDILAAQSPGLPASDYARMVTGTGFIAISRRFGFDVENYHHLTIQDTIDTLGQSVLGLTIGCARCHDHKYDPINASDYYAWYGIFASTKYSFPGSEEKKRPYDLFPAIPPAEAQKLRAPLDAELAKLDAEGKQLEAERKALEPKLVTASITAGATTTAPPPDLAAAKARTDQIATRLKEIAARRDAIAKTTPFEVIDGAAEGGAAKNAQIQIRGEPTKLGAEAPRKNLDILGNDPLKNPAASGRLELADWLTRPQNPLTARVMANRIWANHFGRGLVATENDFGVRGDRPTHAELLDWLASRLRSGGWSLKAMHRLVMLSATYQQGSTDPADPTLHAAIAQADPENTLLWKFPRRRLSAEEIRDAMLVCGGTLDASPGGAHPFPAVESWGFTQHAPFAAVYPSNHRSVYLMQQRLRRHPFLALFDGADPNVSTGHRGLTTVPTQALYLMNDEFVHAQSQALARRVLAEPGSTSDRIAKAYGLSLARPPREDETREVIEFLATSGAALGQSPVPTGERELAAWTGFAQTLLTRNEFLFVD